MPEGKPHIVYAQNTSSTSIRIQWTPPPKNTIHGEFEGYRITYKQRDRPDDEAREVVIRNSQTTVSDEIKTSIVIKIRAQ